MSRLGHASAQAALRYQHAAAPRDKAIAVALSELTEQAFGRLQTSADSDVKTRYPPDTLTPVPPRHL